jgi:hypothetical protein
MPRQHGHRRLIIIAKARPFDADKWQQLLSAFAYVLHEQRQQREAAAAAAATSPAPTKDEL